ncbi:MAG: hypothetical protein CO030_05415 [Candidatus Magasanikbacteria bacterium CG_4_9_14_0_2_um_filter_42_11]|uniref:HNH nuclease domain-containing protein n=1 Tax=Candidatus Magasanikbacteria bacterium CG_4_9_14_0_2_um_filter_42_11 TaxID=1974643 RepID=A0A2M8F8E4_9BACT|nr:MAG: hypothetical protein COU34_02545 [Candidatus Magasanikbacteria bacterium CG10_big_fil_rev_8_21_14_0_10_43_9]PIY92896.1 MAG: hypothetical protein COY70_00810 [Candidatus Magasanikbacteria bacterium CG_4_10_14_0_8_um_filter_42_12]PJC51949.1 MAG: hypothetical protein CO030_05415 [Candidatus Magasanikbacteria bacterium CG_4_9_14_0_2_um_filter_42_11]
MRRKRSWTSEDLKNAVALSTSYRQVLGRLGLKPARGNYAQVKKYISEQNLCVSHFKGKGWSRGLKGVGTPARSLKSILVKNSDYQSYKLKKRLFAAELKFPQCELCGWAKQSVDGRIPLELDHINGVSTDNRIENLRILCPNCHSLQPTHRGLNQKRNKKKKG